MCNEFVGDEEVVATKQDFGYYVTFATEVFEVLFSSQVIETDRFGCFPALCDGETAFAVPVNNLEAVFLEFKADIAAGFDLVAVFNGEQ